MFETYSWTELFLGTAALLAMNAFGLGALVVVTLLLASLVGDVVSAAILAAAAPLLATSTAAIWNNYREAQKRRDADYRRRQSEAYERFLEFLYDAVRRIDDQNQPNDLDLTDERYGQFVQDLLSWGSDDLIELWNEFRHVDLARLDPETREEWFGRLLEQVRSELHGSRSDLPIDELYDLYSTEDSRN